MPERPPASAIDAAAVVAAAAAVGAGAGAGACDGPAPPSLSARLREGTRHLHARAERAGLMPALLRGELPLPGYVRLLQELQALYEALESALSRPGAPAFDPALFRAAALGQDLAALAPRCRADAPAGEVSGAESGLGEGYRVDPFEGQARTAVMRDYVRHVQGLPPALLAAHAYVRYLGDLAGGQVLRRIVARSYGLQDHGVRFYAFGPAVPGLVAGLRQVLDALPAEAHGPIVAEACSAFQRHVELFEALAA
jgi:heme oxygenase